MVTKSAFADWSSARCSIRLLAILAAFLFDFAFEHFDDRLDISA